MNQLSHHPAPSPHLASGSASPFPSLNVFSLPLLPAEVHSSSQAQSTPCSSRKPSPFLASQTSRASQLHLARGLHTLEDTEEHDDPGEQQAKAEVPADVPGTSDALASLDVEDVAAVGDKA